MNKIDKNVDVAKRLTVAVMLDKGSGKVYVGKRTPRTNS